MKKTIITFSSLSVLCLFLYVLISFAHFIFISSSLDFRVFGKTLPPAYSEKILTVADQIFPFLQNEGEHLNLPVIRMEMSRSDQKSIEKAIENRNSHVNKKGYSFKTDISRKVKLTAEKKEYEATINFHGDEYRHYSGQYKSFSFKLKNDSAFDGMKEFSLILLSDSYFNRYVASEFCQKVGLPVIQDEFVRLYINNIYQGIYYLREKINKDMLEKNKLSSNVILRQSYKSVIYQTILGETQPNGHMNVFMDEISGLSKDKDDPRQQRAFARFEKLQHAIKNNDSKTLFEAIDYQAALKFEALRMILGESNIIAGDNLRILYDFSSGKFSFVPNFEGINELYILRYSPEKAINSYQYSVSSMVFSPLFKMLNQNEHFRKDKYKLLFTWFENIDFLKLYDRATENVASYEKASRLNIARRNVSYWTKQYRSILKNNIDNIKYYFNRARLFANIRQYENELDLEIMADSISFLELTHLKLLLENPFSGSIQWKWDNGIEGSVNVNEEIEIDLAESLKGQIFSCGYNDQMAPIKSKKHLKLLLNKAPSVKGVDLGARNIVTGHSLEEESIFTAAAVFENKDYQSWINRSISEVLKEYPFLSYDPKANEIVWEQGKYIIDETVVIPKGYTLKLKPGVKILIGPDQSILSYSRIEIKGTKDDPVVITSQDPSRPFAVVAAIDTGETPNSLSYLELSHGNEGYVNGVYFSGALCIYHGSARINFVKIHDNHADDGLNIKNGQVLIENSSFYNNYADQVDLDFCEGQVRSSSFESLAGDTNGDGLDVSGSLIIVKNNSFKGFKDKGISIGEASHLLVYKNLFDRNNMGVAVKDNSIAVISSNEFLKNTFPIVAYNKKSLFQKGGTVVVDQKSNLAVKKDSLSQEMDMNQLQINSSSFDDLDIDQLRDVINNLL